MPEPFGISAHASPRNIEIWARAQSPDTQIKSKVGQDGQTILYAKKLGFSAKTQSTTTGERIDKAKTLVDKALQTDPPVFKPVTGSGVHQTLFQQATLKDLPAGLATSKEFKAAANAFGEAFAKNDKAGCDRAVATMSKLFSNALEKQPFSVQMKFALSCPDTLAHQLKYDILNAAAESLQAKGINLRSIANSDAEALGLGRNDLLKVIDTAMSNLSDRQLSDKKIVVGGVEYERRQPLGAGGFGETHLYQAVRPLPLPDGVPSMVVVKTPKPNLHAGLRESTINGPLREARCLVNATGTGGAELADKLAKFHSVIRGPEGQVKVVMRLEERKSSVGVLKAATFLNNHPDPQYRMPDSHYEAVSMTLFKDMVEGALRYNEGGKLVHYDLKLDNLLVSKDGVGKVTDPGNARSVGNADPLASPNGIHFLTTSYTAPDHRDRQPSADMFSLGITLYEIMAKKPLRLNTNFEEHPLFSPEEQSRLAGRSNDVRREATGRKLDQFGQNPNAVLLPPGSVPEGSLLEKYQGLINQMTSPDPTRRPTMEQLLSHPLINQMGIGSDQVRQWIVQLAGPPVRPQQPQPSFSDLLNSPQPQTTRPIPQPQSNPTSSTEVDRYQRVNTETTQSQPTVSPELDRYQRANPQTTQPQTVASTEADRYTRVNTQTREQSASEVFENTAFQDFLQNSQPVQTTTNSSQFSDANRYTRVDTQSAPSNYTATQPPDQGTPFHFGPGHEDEVANNSENNTEPQANAPDNYQRHDTDTARNKPPTAPDNYSRG